MRETIPVAEVEIGMFVADLDRPWLGTPFLLQGFLVETEEQIAQLRRCCQTVVIDRSRSLGTHFATPQRANPPRSTLRQIAPEDTVVTYSAETQDFATTVKRLRQQRRRRTPGRLPPPVSPSDRQSRLEEELDYSAPIVDDIQHHLAEIHHTLEQGRALELGGVVDLVNEMAQAVERNPDALIWLTRLRSSDDYSYDHAVDVSVHLMVFARFLGLPAPTIEMLGRVGLMQDIGKVRLPQCLLSKSTPLSDEERRLIQRHVASSLEILSGQPAFPPEALTIVGSHHERHDGSGYPRQIKGETLALYAEMAGLIDTYCALTRQRPYRDALSSQQALERLVAMRDRQFRAPLVDQLTQCLGLYPVGSLVELSSGEVAVVIQQNAVRRLKPRVMIVLDVDKSPLRHPRTLDLIMAPATVSGEPYRIVRALPLNAYGIDAREYFLA